MKPDDFITTTAGIRMPKIIYGTAWKKERTAQLVEQAIVAGFRGIDTACQPKHYHEARNSGLHKPWFGHTAWALPANQVYFLGRARSPTYPL